MFKISPFFLLWLVAFAAVGVTCVWFWQQGGAVSQTLVLGMTMLCLVCLVLGVLPEYVTMLWYTTALILFGLVPTSVVFSGFLSPGFWMVFAGMVIGMACQKTGLVKRLSARLFQHERKERYATCVAMMIGLGGVLAVFLPSTTGRAMLLLPLSMAFAEAKGFARQSRGYNGLILASILGTTVIGFAFLPANLSNMILMGAAKVLYHHHIAYSQFVLLHLPILGIVKAVVLWALLTRMCHDHPTLASTPPSGGDQGMQSSSWTWPEVKLAVYLVAVVVAWSMDSITHLSPAWPGMVVAMLCLLPGLGVLDPETFAKEAPLTFLFYVAGIIGLATILYTTGVASHFEQAWLAAMPWRPGHDGWHFALLSFGTTLMGLLTTLPGVPAVVTPFAGHLAKLTGLSLHSVLMTQVMGYATFILPYQAPPIMVAVRLGHVPLKVAGRVCLWMAGLSVVLILPLDGLWWHHLGMLKTL